MTGTGGSFLIFELEGERYAISMDDMAEVMEQAPLYPIPRAPGYYPGMANCHGMPTPVLDLAAFLGKADPRPRGGLLLLDRDRANLALSVDRVLAIGPQPAAPQGGDSAGDGIRRLSLEQLLTELEEGMNQGR